jgi:hypothetical protein
MSLPLLLFTFALPCVRFVIFCVSCKQTTPKVQQHLAVYHGIISLLSCNVPHCSPCNVCVCHPLCFLQADDPECSGIWRCTTASSPCCWCFISCCLQEPLSYRTISC